MSKKSDRPKSGCYAFVMYVIWANVVIWILLIGFGAFVFFNPDIVSNSVRSWLNVFTKTPATPSIESSKPLTTTPVPPQVPNGPQQQTGK